MDITSHIAAQSYGLARPATKPDEGGAMLEAVGDFAKVLEQGETTAKGALNGSADPHALVEALAQSELAVQTAVTVRDKVVEAYQEILRMPV